MTMVANNNTSDHVEKISTEKKSPSMRKREGGVRAVPKNIDHTEWLCSKVANSSINDPVDKLEKCVV